MKITYKGDYAVKAILDLAYRYSENKAVPLSEISKRQDVPAQYLEQIMLILKGAKFVESKRGVGGGFFLLKDPEDVTLGEIIELIEGPLEPIVCGKRNHDCSCGEEEVCAFREVWVKVTETTREIVDTVTFADMMRRTTEIHQANMAYDFQI